MSDDASRAKFESVWLDSIDLDHAHPLVWIPLADLRPREWLGDRRGELHRVHPVIVDGCESMSSFRQAAQNINKSDADVVVISTGACTATYAPLLGNPGDVSTGIQLLASERGLPINGTYSARTQRDCAAEERAWSQVAIRPGVLYVVFPQARVLAERWLAGGGRCLAFETAYVCSTETDVLASWQAPK